MRHNMADYAKNACSLYEELTGRSLKAASTPFVEMLMVGPSGQTRHHETPVRPN